MSTADQAEAPLAGVLQHRCGMRQTRTVRVKNPVDLLAMVPCVLGFHPEDSLVLVTTGEAMHAFHARVDLPDDPSDVPAVVDSLSEAVHRNPVSGVAVVTYSDDHALCLEVLDAVQTMLAEHGARVVVAVRADGERWYCLAGTVDEPCCPPQGSAYDLTSHPLTAQAVLDGQVVLRNRRELAESLAGADPAAIAAVEQATGRALSRGQAATRHPLGPPDPEQAWAFAVAEGVWVRERVRRFLGDGRPVSEEDAGRLLAAMRTIDVRDVAWAEMSRDNAAKHVRLWRDLVQRSPEDFVAAPAALLGFAAWLTGDGALAWCAVDRCLQVEPGYRLAGLLSTALVNAVPPSTWRPIPKEELALFAG